MSVHRPTARLAEVPRGVDRTATSRGASSLRSSREATRGCATDRPGDAPDRAVLDDLARPGHVRAQHSPGEATIRSRGSKRARSIRLPRPPSLSSSVEVDVLAGLQRGARLLEMEPDRLAIVTALTFEDSRSVSSDGYNLGIRTARQLLGPINDGIRERRHDDAIGHIRQREMGQGASERQGADPHDPIRIGSRRKGHGGILGDAEEPILP